MGTTTETIERRQEPERPPEEDDRSTRRLLKGLLGLLGVGALALLGLLLWLLRPESQAAPQGPAGYPIQVVTTIYGHGESPDTFVTWPLGVAFDAAGNVWISNTGQGRVEQYTSDGGYIRAVGEERGPGELGAPYGLAFDQARDRVYVADPARGVVQVFTGSTGGYVGHLPADDQDLGVFGADGFTPYDVELSGGRIVVSSNDGLYFFDDNGHVVARWGGATRKGENLRGNKLGAFNFPDAFAVDADTGRIYVADTLNRRVVALGSAGRWRWVSGSPDADQEITSFWQLPRGIEVGPDGNLYVVDTFRADAEGMGTGHLVVLSPDGDLLSEFGRAGTADGSFSFPEQLASGPDGLWAIADRENNRVVVFRLLTPYPEVDDAYAERYPATFRDLATEAVTSTPSPVPTG
ncbi:MAG TPA: hypothetical protein VE669_00700 [Actinomycetota bacterium]|jgi:DNA-binding beta-propeller fold protein YncE|nr:hypothetical protein [Actinomycetota bacterium]